LVEDRDGVMMKPAGKWRRWIPIVVMIAWIYAASSLLQNAASAATKYTILGGVIGITEVLVGLSIAAGQVFPFAAGLIFLGTLLSCLPLSHAGSFSFPPDHWKIAVALAGSVALFLSPWIRRMVQRLSTQQLASLDERQEPKRGRDSREDVRILIRLDRGFDFFRKSRCTVTILHPKESERSAAHALEKASKRSERRPSLPDHKLPFWVR
jgi:uncharacterized membrane protein YphA (DoxX/SURF4 family)